MTNFSKLRDLYRSTLLDQVMPWWMRHTLDANGGMNNAVREDGTVVNRDRWIWSQWRAVWMFSKLYNSLERREEWLDAARRIYGFLLAHGPGPDGWWPLVLDGDGAVLRGPESIFTDGFAVYGLAEYMRATGDLRARGLALRSFHLIEAALRAPGPPPTWPYPTAPGHAQHGASMLFSLVNHELAQVTGDPAACAASAREHRRVMDVYLRPDRGVVLEWLARDGREIAAPKGTVVCPGHAIESMWMQMHIARARNDRATLDRATAAIRRHLELGWDEKYGGIFLAVDADGRKEVAWEFADSKLEWPQVEALYATLLAYDHCREPWCLEWHERVREFCYSRYPVKGHGIWRQNLSREGKPFREVVALPVMDPFHLPRALYYCVEVLGRLTK